MTREELLAVLRLQKTKSIGDILAKKLITTIGSAAQIFNDKATSLVKVHGIGKGIIAQLRDKSSLEIAKRELDYIEKNKIEFSYFLEDDYPENLRHCVDSPILLFKDGNVNFANEKILSIVGTRTVTNYGKAFCRDLVESLAEFHPIIVSGFAYGVDISAHKAAIKNGLQTIAVLAHGLDEVYPKSHKKYIHQLNENGGLLTEFFHDEKPMRENFLKRNRIVAGLSKATIIIESGAKGGSLVTADIANSYNRDVFAVPGRTTDLMSSGCNRLIQQNKAHLLQSAEDIIQLLNWDVKSKSTRPKQKTLFISLNEKEQKVYDFLSENNQQLLDVISLQTQIPVYELAPILLQMELKGVVKPLPGKNFILA